jgi:hypothetical protein
LSKESLKDALATHIVVENLPFTYVESRTFLDIVKLLNPEAVNLMVKADAMTDNVIRMYGGLKTKLAQAMCDENVTAINCTCDVWTSPNNFGIFAVTGHWLDQSSELQVC